MNRQMVAGLAAVGVLAVGGVTAWWFTTGDAEPTSDVSAPEVAPTTTVSSPGSSEMSSASGDGSTVYELTDETTASFTIDEELRGEPVTVVAVSTIVVGQIRIDPADLANSQVGTVLVNARDFTTDSSFRDRAIRGPILDSDAVEFVEFTPTGVDGLEGALEPGADVTFTVTGDLTVRDVTNPATFTVTARVDDSGLLVGFATTTVLRSDYDLTIPSAPGVANVADEVELSIEFVAAPTG